MRFSTISSSPELIAAAAEPTGVSGETAQLFQFHRGQDVFFMLMLVAFLMMFIRRFEWGVALTTLLVLAVSWPLYLIGYTEILGNELDIDAVILGVFASITLVIAIGVFLGHLSTIHFILASVLFVPAYMANEWFLFGFLDGVLDSGGSILVHMFAAYWGWGVILGLRNRRVSEVPQATSVHSVSFVWLASMLLFVLWPSFVTALLPPEAIIPGMINTYLALTASVLITYVLLWALKRTIDPLVYTYAILAGGVAIGASVDLASPLQSWIIGLLGGAASTLCFVYVHDWLCRKTGVLDTMGVHNLHGVPGILGGLVPLVLFGAPLDQLWAVLGTLVIGLVTGVVAGLILRLFPKPDRMLDDAESFPLDDVRATEVP
ncbi:ammonium transporter [Citricoccus alkalitolerans]|uniref:Ammonium transporter n=1 Tax=Citricoccus alkalitolerans TaxID=246603 RepID=A0ABV8Y0A9_9MICC